MQFTNLGFLFLLLPVSTAIYYCFPARLKPAALLGISFAFYYILQPEYIWFIIPVALDCLVMNHINKNPLETQQTEFLYRLCIIINIIIMLTFGILLPILQHTPVPIGIMVVSLSLIELLVIQQRSQIEFFSPIKAASSALFFGRIVHGPVSATQNLITQLNNPSPSLSRIARGIMMLITGITKHVVLSEQFFALLKTISRIPPNQFSVSLSWLCALCSALGIYFNLSAFSDIAMGIGNIFSLNLPRILYYPFQARSIREYIYRLNMPLEDTLTNLLFPKTNREAASSQGYLISFFMALLLGLWFFPSGGFLLWGGYLSVVVIIDWFILRHIPTPIGLAARIVTFVITLPAYVLILPTTLYNRFMIIVSMMGLGKVPIINDAVIYLFSSNFVLLIIGILTCSSIFDALGHATEQQFPQLWWVLSSLAHLGLLVISTSFLLLNVR